MNEKELEESLKSYQNRVSHLETLIYGLQSVRVSNANCHFNMNTDELRKAKDLLMEYSKKELDRVDDQIKVIKRRLEQHHFICSECNKKIESMERPEQCFNCQSNAIITINYI